MNTPDTPGGGTVKWTNRWGGYSYISDIEVKEDGGTPGFLQGIKAALAITLKENMGTRKIHQREKELIEITFRELSKIKGLTYSCSKYQGTDWEFFHFMLIIYITTLLPDFLTTGSGSR